MGFTIDGSGFHKEKMEGKRFEESIRLYVAKAKDGLHICIQMCTVHTFRCLHRCPVCEDSTREGVVIMDGE